MLPLLLLIVAHFLAGCRDASRDDVGQTNLGAMPLPRSTREVTIPAGATVMALRPLPAIDTLYLDSLPILDIGRVDPNRITGAELRGAEFGAAFMSDSSLVVLDRFEVKIFERNGRLRRVVGRDGRGPGEFLRLTTISICRGDTIVVEDGNNARLGVFTKAGTLVRHIPLDRREMISGGCFTDGTLLMRKLDRASPIDARKEALTRLSLDGKTSIPLGIVDGRGEDPEFLREIALAVDGMSYYYGDGRGENIDRFTISAKSSGPVSSVKTGFTADPIPSSERERRRKGSFQNPKKYQKNGKFFVPEEATWPMYRDVEVGPSGELWVNRYRRSADAPDIWIRFVEGKPTGVLVVPREETGRPTILTFLRDAVLLGRYDEDGSRHIAVHRLHAKVQR